MFGIKFNHVWIDLNQIQLNTGKIGEKGRMGLKEMAGGGRGRWRWKGRGRRGKPRVR